MRPPFIYWVKFDKDPAPIRMFAMTFQEFQLNLERLTYQSGQMVEWLVRDYK